MFARAILGLMIVSVLAVAVLCATIALPSVLETFNTSSIPRAERIVHQAKYSDRNPHLLLTEYWKQEYAWLDEQCRGVTIFEEEDWAKCIRMLNRAEQDLERRSEEIDSYMQEHGISKWW